MYSQYQLQASPQPQVAPSPNHSRSPTQASFHTPYLSANNPHSPVSPTLRFQPTGHVHQMSSARNIGGPIYYSAGQFERQTIRMELIEIQKADLGRKYARVDRRPLDPPPVVHLKLFRLENAGTEHQTEAEMSYDDVQVLGFLCTVDLFPVPGPEPLPIQGNTDCSAKTSSPTPNRKNVFQSPPFSNPSPPSTSSLYSPDGHSRSYVTRDNSHPPYAQYQEQSSPRHPDVGLTGPQSPAPNVVHRIGDYPITEDSKQTQALVGATFVQPAVVDYQGSKAIVFVFSDLAVKIEGTFILRYRMFDIFSRPCNQQNDLAITAVTYGGPFRVYSTKEFPGLAASTELTKHLARWGVRLNIRETERRRRKRPGDGRRSPTSDDEE